MAKKVTLGGFAVAVFALMVNLGCLCLPFHKTDWHFVRLSVIKFVTYAIRIEIQTQNTVICGTLTSVGGGRICENEGTWNLNEVAQFFCTDGMEHLFSGACSGLMNAWRLGILIVVTVFFNLLLSCASVCILYKYLTDQPKTQHRRMAAALQAAGCAIVVIPLLLYIPRVIVDLDHVRLLIPTWVIGTSRLPGASAGYIGLWIGFVLQLLCIGLCSVSDSANERCFMEAREIERAALEMQEMSAAEAASYGLQKPGPGAPHCFQLPPGGGQCPAGGGQMPPGGSQFPPPGGFGGHFLQPLPGPGAGPPPVFRLPQTQCQGPPGGPDFGLAGGWTARPWGDR